MRAPCSVEQWMTVHSRISKSFKTPVIPRKFREKSTDSSEPSLGPPTTSVRPRYIETSHKSSFIRQSKPTRATPSMGSKNSVNSSINRAIH